MSHEESHVVCSEPRLPRVSVHVDPARLHRRSFSLRPHRLAMGVRHLHVALVVVLALPVPGAWAHALAGVVGDLRSIGRLVDW